MENIQKIGLGGGCHWCTEAVFQAVKGVQKVEQGYIASTAPADAFSEAVIVHYHPKMANLETLIEIHLRTHNATSNHSFRSKYRSTVYCFSSETEEEVRRILEKQQQNFEEKLVTQVLPFREFRASRESIQDYYKRNPEAPFCKKFIEPKLKILRNLTDGFTQRAQS